MTDALALRLLSWCADEGAWLLDTIAALVRLESPSTDKPAVDRCGDELTARLHAIGAAVRRIDVADRGNHIVAEFAARGDRAPRVLLLGHFDTVWEVGQLERMPLKEDRDARRLYGPGTFDMKSGIGVAMLAMRALNALDVADRPHVTMLWTTDEEIGSGTSRNAIEAIAREHDAVLVLEPALPGGAAKTSRKGVGELELTVHGVSAHAGLDPGKGASAIHELAHQIVAIERLQDPNRGVTLNVGRMAGGSRTNVVADTAHASIDVRVQTMADAETVMTNLRALRPVLRGTRLELSGGVDRPPLERTPGVEALYRVARAAARDLGQDLAEGPAGGGSDGNFTAAIGVPTLDGLGPRGDGAHALHEHVEVDDLPWRAAFLAELLRRLGRDRVANT
jgi:glutamate carboxypeptidase